MEVQLRERWMHGRQRARFSPFTSHRRPLYLDSIRDAGGRRTFFVTTSRNAYGGDSAVITTDSEGHIVRYAAGLAPYRNDGPRWPGDSARMARFRRFRHVASAANSTLLELAEARSWDLVPTFPRRPAPRLQWTDTIAREAVDGPYRQTLTGTRTSRILRDTTIDGRQLWIVRDSAQLRYSERYPEPQRTLGADATVSRSVMGIEHGTHLFDPVLGLYRWRHDTAALRGEAVLQSPDGRSFTTPAIYERSRHWVLRDSLGYAEWVNALNAERRRTSGGMVRTPTPLQRRVADGDTLVRDSLVREWRQASDPNEGEEIFRSLTGWSGRDTLFSQRLDSLRIGAGDSLFLYRRLVRLDYRGRTAVDSVDIARLLPFMENPGLAWGLNASSDWPYENLVQTLTTLPPAIAGDSDRVACSPAACRLLASQWRVATEPRTRDVGLVALFTMDPARWADTTLAQASPGRPLLERAAHLASGVASTAPAAAKQPFPPVGSDTSAWLEWLIGEDPEYAAARRAMAERFGRPVNARNLHFGDDHRVAMRLYALRTGRDVVAELRRNHERATSERERLIFATMLQGLGELQMTAEQIASEFRAGIPERARTARRALVSLFAREARPIEPAQASPLIDRLIASIVDSWPLWPHGAADMGPASAGRPELHARRGLVRLSAENLPAELVEKWGKKVEILSSSARGQLNPREATVVYTVSRVTGIGPFARIEMRADEQLARPADHAPAHYASATMYYLMNRDGEWVIVAAEGWVT